MRGQKSTHVPKKVGTRSSNVSGDVRGHSPGEGKNFDLVPTIVGAPPRFISGYAWMRGTLFDRRVHDNHRRARSRRPLTRCFDGKSIASLISMVSLFNLPCTGFCEMPELLTVPCILIGKRQLPPDTTSMLMVELSPQSASVADIEQSEAAVPTANQARAYW
jgi:hypothetical protein